MFGGVVVHDIQSLGMMPSLGAMIGNVHSPAVLERLNMASGGGVIFGQPGDPYRDNYAALRNTVVNNLMLADTSILQVKTVITSPEKIVPITNIEQMYNPPPSMIVPILTYAPIRTLLEDGRIDGFGIDPRYLPEEDVYGRLIDNGKVDLSEKDAEFVWCWKTDDPEASEEDLLAVEQTRGWIDSWLLEQMKPGGDFIDPTDPANKIRKKKSDK